MELSSANGGMLRDLSEQGFAMRAMMPLRAGESTPFSFSLNPETRLAGQCKVLWVAEDGRLAGLQFTEVETELPTTIRTWLAENSFVAPSEGPSVKPPVREASTLEELRDELRTIAPNVGSPERAPAESEAGSLEGQPAKKDENVRETVSQVELAPVETAFEPATGLRSNLERLPSLDPLPEIEANLGRAAVNRGVSRSIVSLALRMMIFLALLAGAIVYHRPLGNAVVWLGQKIAGSDTPEISYPTKPDDSGSSVVAPPANQAASSTETAVPTPPGAARSSPASDAASAEKNDAVTANKQGVEVPPVVQNPAPLPAKNPLVGSNATPPVPVPATNKTTTFTPLSGSGPEAPGQQEFLAAQDILKGKNPQVNLADAVKLLWAAVEKGNSGAEVLLAELYQTGRGVSKNCDQTKILLTAAAHKGNAEAQKRLDEFLKEGCE